MKKRYYTANKKDIVEKKATEYHSLNKAKKDKRNKRINRYYHNVLKNNPIHVEKIRVRSRDRYYKGEILKEFGDKCSKCGSTKELQLHHHDYNEKPIALCKSCHFEVHGKTDWEEFKKKLGGCQTASAQAEWGLGKE
jgi:DNA-directed RNA polymerase subunit M/transcription elongation factor TFIIS